MTSAVFTAGVLRRRPLRFANAAAPLAVLPLSANLAPAVDPHRLALQAGGFLLLALAVHSGIAWFFANGKVPEEIPARPVPVEITLARPLPSVPATQPSPLPQASKPSKPVVQRSVEPLRRVADLAPSAEPSEVQAVEAAADTGKVSLASLPAPVELAAPFLPETLAVGHMGYLNNPPPEYPASALDRGLEGTTLLKVRVLANGRAASVEIERSSGARILDDAALRTVRRWLFVAATRDGQAVDGWANVPIVFKLGK